MGLFIFNDISVQFFYDLFFLEFFVQVCLYQTFRYLQRFDFPLKHALMYFPIFIFVLIVFLMFSLFLMVVHSHQNLLLCHETDGTKDPVNFWSSL